MRAVLDELTLGSATLNPVSLGTQADRPNQFGLLNSSVTEDEKVGKEHHELVETIVW